MSSLLIRYSSAAYRWQETERVDQPAQVRTLLQVFHSKIACNSKMRKRGGRKQGMMKRVRNMKKGVQVISTNGRWLQSVRWEAVQCMCVLWESHQVARMQETPSAEHQILVSSVVVDL